MHSVRWAPPIDGGVIYNVLDLYRWTPLVEVEPTGLFPDARSVPARSDAFFGGMTPGVGDCELSLRLAYEP